MLVDRGFAESLEKATALVLAGAVRVNGQRLEKPGHAVTEDAVVEVTQKLRYVSRGGLKLEGALDTFAIDPTGMTCLDIGSSTGGFTDCLLQRGALRVYAIDSGTSQLDWRIRNDARVLVKEKYNARHLKGADFPGLVGLLVCDVSFISVMLVLPPAQALLQDDAQMVILIKPQFEASREQVGKGGIVRDPLVHREVCTRIETFVQAKLGFAHTRIIDSPILGAEGNQEFLLHARH